MGGGSYSSRDWEAYSSKVSSKSVSEICRNEHIDEYLDPLKFSIRESRDSAAHPVSVPVIVGIDVTGSMDPIIDDIMKHSLGVMFQSILDRKPIADPHLMFIALGDAYCDSAPVQVSQFEADNTIIPQLEKVYVERGGGGNESESYDFAWYIASRRTSVDHFDKRGKKGYLFTIGDECAPAGLTRKQIARFAGDEVQSDFSALNLYNMACEKFNVFHLVVEEGVNFRSIGPSRVYDSWRSIMGQHVIPLADHSKIGEVIVSTIQVMEGEDKAKVSASWSGDTSIVVAKAIKDLVPDSASGIDVQ